MLAYAFDRGINFVDTAQYYMNYPIIRRALELCSAPGDVILSTKTYAYSREGAAEAVEEAAEAAGETVEEVLDAVEEVVEDTEEK